MEIWREIRDSDPFRSRVVDGIRTLSTQKEEDDEDFTAQDLRRKLPVIIKKPHILRKFVDGKIDLEEGYQRAKISRAEERVKQALSLLEEISEKDVSGLDSNSLNSLRQVVRKLKREVTVRISGMVEKEVLK